ncbi:uncharacterized protein LOC120107765 [Phoenix dactylifera]|uniref:Uncharacterized protein LOC120107765 n=1 Tax=Phoenix dactylifera TaxID=42345 RepID=A0A8B8ZZX5_PHODC|nr:uncharacterized protein LOC120107765 [Phoenix dactylifera]
MALPSGSFETKRELSDVVLKWSIDDVLNEDLLKHKIKEIPETFVSVNHYFESFRHPFIEETRAQFASCLNSIADSPRIDVNIEKACNQMEFAPNNLVGFRWSSGSMVGRKAYTPREGDIVLLTIMVPKDVSELKKLGAFNCLAFVSEVEKYEERHFMARLGAFMGSTVKTTDLSFVAIFLLNIANKSQVWNAMNVDVDDPNANLNLIKRILHADGLVAKACPCSLHAENTLSENLLQKIQPVELNESQIKAICLALSTIRCCDSFSINRISGYPGTGKTEIISIICWIALQRKIKVVVCAPTTFSTFEVVQRLLKLIEQCGSNASEGMFPGWPLSDVVVLGDEHAEKLYTSHGFTDILLEDRLILLEPCFSAASGWKKHMSLMIDLLEKFCLNYDILLENEHNDFLTGYLEILKGRFASVAFPFKDCMQLLLKYLPHTLFSVSELKNLSSLVNLIDSMWSILCDDLVKLELVKLFTGKEVEERDLEKNGWTLSRARDYLLEILNVLIDTLRLPVTAGKRSIEHLLLKHAGLILCPVPQSPKLKSMGSIGPFDLLIVDRAGEVNECELLLPLQLHGLQHTTLVGGDCSLPAIVVSKNLHSIGYKRSLLERISYLCKPDCTLEVQYRMHPEISYFPNKKLFNWKLVDSPKTLDGNIKNLSLPDCISAPFSFLDVSDGQESFDGQDEGWKNLIEAAVICKIVMSLLKAWRCSRSSLSVGVICPYSAQAHTIQAMLSNKYEIECGFLFWVSSCNELKSSEEDVIIISTVRSNEHGSVGLWSDHQITNYCLTRARKFLWIAGNAQTLKSSHSVWQELVHDAEERGLFVKVAEHNFFFNTITNVKDELKQLDELLNLESARFNGLKWKVLVSDDFKRSFVGLQDSLTKQIIIGLLWRLACGWRPKHKSLYFSKFVKHFRVHGLSLICTTDIIKESEYIQVMKVWDVLTLTEVPKLHQRLERMMSSFSDCYAKCCMIEKIEGKLVLPMTWAICPASFPNNEPLLYTNGIQSRLEASGDVTSKGKDSEEVMLMKFYALSSGAVKHLLTAPDGQQIELPFELNDLEAKVVTFPDSAFVLGRSGTGKTLVLVTKLIQRQQHYILALQGLSRQEVQLSSTSHDSEEGTTDAVPHVNTLHQIFLTMNPILCSAVKTCISQLRRYAAGEEATKRLKFIEAHGVSENLSRFSEIPNSFMEISESHFPLVISLHKFLIILDGSMKNSFFDKFSDVKAITGGKRTVMSHVLCQLITVKEIDYDHFVSSYWPRFDKNLTRKLEPSLVFSEIIYCIKGGMGTGRTSIYKNMDEDEYTALSENRRSSVSKDKRKMIYKIFMSYEKEKEKCEEYDISDLVNDLHFRLFVYRYEGRKMDYLYVDEVQDFTMKQICLFKHLCVNFQSGFMLSGDTAQALVNDFRFEDIKCLFYKEFLLGLGSVPELFLLSTNFRTHAGILKLAESILDLLHHFFPLLVDRLVSEKSMTHGEAPVLLESENETDVLDTIFGTNETIDHIPFQFGAEQVILVRDKHTKEKLVCRIGNKALVLTIKDCKGLEFQDVLLFNFFEESPLKCQWRVVYEFMDDQKLANPCLPKYPCFDQDKHHILFTELKQLYVAVTRTKRRLWIYESRQDFGGPIFNYWKMLGLVQVERLDSSFVRKMEVDCKIEEWDARGEKFFNDGNYEMAILCFKRSGDVYMENWSKAALLQADGRSKLHVNFQLALDSLSKAADIYESIGKMELAASSIMESREYTKAGMIYLHKCHEPRFEDAGDCFALAGSWSEAAKVYAQGQHLSKCLSACRQALQFDLGLQFLREWPVMVPGDDWIDYMKGTISDYHKLQDIDSLEKFVRAFPTDALGLLLQSDYYEEASVVANLKGDIMLEADMLRIAKHYENSADLVLFYATGKMLWAEGNKGWPLMCFNELQQVLEKARSLCMQVSNDFKAYISAEADFLSDQSASLTSFARHINNAKTSRNICVETFAARKYLDICLQTSASEYYQESDVALWRYRDCSVQDMFSYASIQNLMLSWNSWVKRVKGVLSYFHSIGTPEVSKYTKYEKFCLKFFGVFKSDIEGIYISSNARASWIRWTDEKHLRVLDNVAYMSDLVFNCLAEKYWASEVISVGASLLKKLQELHSHLFRHSSMVQRGIIAHYYYMVLNCLKEHGFPGLECESKRFYESLTNFDAFLCRTFFPLDFSRILEQIETSTQGTNTSLITAVLHRNLGVLDQFGAAKIGRVVVFLLSRKLSHTLHRTIRGMIGREFPWQHFLRELSYSRTEGCQRTTPLAKTFLPSSILDLQSQLLLLESILFYASSCQMGRGWFITSRSSLSAFLNATESRDYFHALSVSSIHSLEVVYRNTTPFYDFILDTFGELFSLRNLRWAAMKRLSTQALVLKMVILVGLICLNSAKHFLKVRKLLKRVAGILSILPHQFLIKFWNSRKGRVMSLKLFGSVLSRSMQSMGDQVVVVRMDGYSESFDHLRPLHLKHSDLKRGKEYAQALLLGINEV